jgi:glucan phosphoethanolaminetransferase (alkaline phosphatase superfamily)
MQVKPIKKKVMVKINLFWILAFFIGFVIILYSINPFETGIFSMILFYLVLFCLLLGTLNLIRLIFKFPFKIILIIDIIIILALLIKSLT